MARTRSTGQNNTPSPAPAPALSPYGTVYKKVSDIPDDQAIAWILPKDDYRGACFMWPVPNGEVVIPGNPLFRMPSTLPVLLSAFGFLPEDQFEDFGVVAVSYCTDWSEYVAKRNGGLWGEELAAIENSPAPAVATTTAPSWKWNDVSYAACQILPERQPQRMKLQSIGQDRYQQAISHVLPSLQFDQNHAADPENGPMLYFTTPAQIQSLADTVFPAGTDNANRWQEMQRTHAQCDSENFVVPQDKIASAPYILPETDDIVLDDSYAWICTVTFLNLQTA